MLNETKMKKLVKKLAESNYKRFIKLRANRLKTGGYSIYLDIWNNGQREYRFLKLYITGDPVRDDEAVRLALALRDAEEKNLHIDGGSYSLSAWKKRSDFLEYFHSLAQKRDRTWIQACKYFSQYAGNKLLFTQLSNRLIDDYRSWLLSGKLSHNTCWIYLSKLNAALNQAVKDGIIGTNPARFVTLQMQDTDRVFLEFEEVMILSKTPCQKESVKRAFLFSCFTGLRYSDIKAITWKDISQDHLTLIQQKTKKQITNKMIDLAKAQLGTRGNDNDKVFALPSKTYLSTVLSNWIRAAGINKQVSFHSARHTFAMLGLSVGNLDIYTLKGLLGHSNLTTTQIYAKLIDKVKDAGMDRLSEALAAKHHNNPKGGDNE